MRILLLGDWVCVAKGDMCVRQVGHGSKHVAAMRMRGYVLRFCNSGYRRPHVVFDARQAD